MSLFAPRNESEAIFQYCNYGYDKSIFTSFDDCMKNYAARKGQMQHDYDRDGSIRVELEKLKKTQTEQKGTPIAPAVKNNSINTKTLVIALGVGFLVWYLLNNKNN